MLISIGIADQSAKNKAGICRRYELLTGPYNEAGVDGILQEILYVLQGTAGRAWAASAGPLVLIPLPRNVSIKSRIFSRSLMLFSV